jgi:hypothetical protein
VFHTCFAAVVVWLYWTYHYSNRSLYCSSDIDIIIV